MRKCGPSPRTRQTDDWNAKDVNQTDTRERGSAILRRLHRRLLSACRSSCSVASPRQVSWSAQVQASAQPGPIRLPAWGGGWCHPTHRIQKMPDPFFPLATETDRYIVSPKVTLTASALLQPPRRFSTCGAVRCGTTKKEGWMGDVPGLLSCLSCLSDSDAM